MKFLENLIDMVYTTKITRGDVKMKKVKLIYNPNSGDKSIIQNLDKIIETYQSYGFMVVPFRLSREVTMEEVFEGINEYEHLLLSGGDGTINSLINSMKELDIDIPVGILGSGTANDFANCLGMPTENIVDSCKQILESTVHEIDLGKVNDKYFVNILSMGVLTDVSQKTNDKLKKKIGKVAYYMQGFNEVLGMKRLKIKIDSEELTFDDSAMMVFVFNGKTAGNINIAYKSELDDGLLDVIIVKGNMSMDTLTTFLKFTKEKHLEDPKGIIYFRTNKLTISSETDIVTDIDGEKGTGFPLDIECKCGALKVLGYKG